MRTTFVPIYITSIGAEAHQVSMDSIVIGAYTIVGSMSLISAVGNFGEN
jgi:hypothetical protein